LRGKRKGEKHPSVLKGGWEGKGGQDIYSKYGGEKGGREDYCARREKELTQGRKRSPAESGREGHTKKIGKLYPHGEKETKEKTGTIQERGGGKRGGRKHASPGGREGC